MYTRDLQFKCSLRHQCLLKLEIDLRSLQLEIEFYVKLIRLYRFLNPLT